MSCAYRISVAFFLLMGVVWAQTASSPDQETVRALVQQVKDLQEKVAALEAKQNPAPVASQPAPAQPSTSTPAPQETAASQEATFRDLHDIHGIQWRGFGEVNYKVLDQRQPELGTFGFVPGSAGNFFVGDFDLFLTSKITERANVLAEVVIGEGDAQSFDVDLERVLFKYDYNDYFHLSLGRYHTGIGYYNEAFHSGKWLQTTADRPLIMEFANDGGLLPTQAVGVSMTGQIPSGALGLNWTFEYGSSDTMRPNINGSGDITDENNGNHLNVGFFARPRSVPGLQVGASYYHDQISNFVLGPSVRLGQTIVNGHVVYNGRGFEFLNEAFLLRNAYQQGGPVYNMPAFYSQISKRFGRIRPYFRYQYVNTNPNSIYHDDVLLRYGPSFGARYDFTDAIGFKTQLDHTIRKGEPDLNGLQMQLAFAF
jgi:hypothetical protein